MTAPAAEGSPTAEGDAMETEDSTPLVEVIDEATKCKERGNSHFKAKRAADACNEYNEGLSILKKHCTKDETDSSVKTLQASLHLNLAASHNMASEWELAISHASSVLDLDPGNIKALYRRGIARVRLLNHDAAKEDLLAVVKADPKNADARRELAALKALIAERKEKDKAKFASMFEKEGKRKSQVEEVEKFRKQKQEEEEKKRKQEEEKREEERMQQLYDEECLRRSTTDEDPIEYEVFKAQEQERQKKAKEEKEAEQKRLQAEEEERRFQANRKHDVVTVEDEELGDVKGYKKRADGSITTFFDRSDRLDETAKTLMGTKPQPKRIETTAGDGGGDAGTGSAWNAAGTTWEDKDMSNWATNWLEGELAKVKVELKGDLDGVMDSLKSMDFATGGTDASMDKLSQLASGMGKAEAKVKEVKKVEGHANIAVVRKTKRFLYDYRVELAWQVTLDTSMSNTLAGQASLDKDQDDKDKDTDKEKEKSSKTFKGTLTFAEVNADVDIFEAKVDFKKPAGKYEKRVQQAVDALIAETQSKLATFVVELKKK